MQNVCYDIDTSGFVVGTQEKCSQVLTHIEKIMRVKHGVLNEKTKTRKTPKYSESYQGGKHQFHPPIFFYYRDWTDCTLTTAVRWLLRQCGRPQTECRHRCMAMFFTLSASLPGSSGPKDVIQALLSEQGPAYIIARLVAAKTCHLLG